MSKKCLVTNKKSIFGRKRSYSMNTSNRKFLPNLHNHRLWIPKKKRFIRFKLSTKAIRIINKKGIEKVFNNIV